MSEPLTKESVVLFKASHDEELRGNPLRLTRFAAAFELYGTGEELRLSESLNCFRIMVRGRTIYAGRAVVRSLVQTGPVIICETTLDETAWQDVEFDVAMAKDGGLAEKFDYFLTEWQRIYRVVPEFKVVLADMQSFFMELRLWLNQLELGMTPLAAADRTLRERTIVDGLAGPVVGAIDGFVERFEAIAGRLEDELHPAHRAYLRRQLHPLLLCSPFAHRAFTKPLGYAGDYEVVNMMLRSPYEGSSLFAKVVNVWLLGQAPAEAHRNRVAYLKRKLLEETLRLASQGRRVRIFNLGCGPAHEVKLFLREEALSDRIDLTLVDFNEETLVRLEGELSAIQSQHGRSARIEFVKKSVHQLLKETSRKSTSSEETPYDYIYCAGLYDYLSDQVCSRLNDLFHSKLAPGGLLLTTNVSEVLNDSRPFRFSMEYMLDWMLIYRDGRQFAALKPEEATADTMQVISEQTGVNLFMEVRKPTHV